MRWTVRTLLFGLAIMLMIGCGGDDPGEGPADNQQPDNQQPGVADAISVEPDAIEIGVDETETIFVEVLDEENRVLDDVSIDFAMLDTTVATIDEVSVHDDDVTTAVLLGQSAGETGLLISTDTLAEEISLSVTEEDPPQVDSLDITPEAPTVEEGDTTELEATVWDVDGQDVTADVDINWSSNDDSIATVDDDGLAMGIDEGTTQIIAETLGISDEVTIEVSPAPPTATPTSYLTLDRGYIAVGLDETTELQATMHEPDGSTLDVPLSWEIDDTAVATVDDDGTITGEQLGTTDLTVSHQDLETHAVVDVVPHFDDLVVGPGKSLFGSPYRAEHICGLTPDGAAYCWGDNESGKLGNGSDEDSWTPVPVSGDHEFAQLALGGHHSCGLTVDGDTYCWGDNADLQLGVADIDDSDTPVDVQGDHEFVTLNAGLDHTCGITDDGDAYCWGLAGNGQTGSGQYSLSEATLPEQVEGDHQWDHLSAGFAHTCGVTTDGDAYCWGSTQSDQLGFEPDSGTRVWTPETLDSDHSFISISAGGYHTCAITDDADTYCWGDNGQGQLGDGTTDSRWQPEAVSLPDDAVALQTSRESTCAELVDESTLCWGRNREGHLGFFDARQIHSPDTTDVVDDFDLWSLGVDRSCGLRPDGVAQCWGTTAQWGVFDYHTLHEPTRVVPWSDVDSVAVQFRATCVAGDFGDARCWGNRWNGNLGDATGTMSGTSVRRIPNPLDASSPLDDLVAHSDSACGLDDQGEAYCWGSGSWGELGTGDDSNLDTPTAVDGGHLFHTVERGSRHTCGITDQQQGFCWGVNESRLGNGDTESSTSPEPWDTDLNFDRLAAGRDHNCALTVDDEAYCWGNNAESLIDPDWAGAVGDGTDEARVESPSAVSGNHSFHSIAAGDSHSCAIDEDDDLWCWGGNTHGQLGTGDLSDEWTPEAANTSQSFQHLAAGARHTCALNEQGHAFCWGVNEQGQLGTGDVDDRLEPTPVNRHLEFVDLVLDSRRSCGITADGGLYCWGANPSTISQSSVMPRTVRPVEP